MLFFFTGFLFFLGGVNMLVARIFGDAWTAMGINMQAAMAYRSVTAPVKSTFRDFKRELIGSTSVASIAGRTIKQTLTKRGSNDNNASSNGGSNNTSKTANNNSNNSSQPANRKTIGRNTNQTRTIPQFSQNLAHRGLEVKMENHKQGVVSLTGDAYRYNDSKTGLTSIYPSRLEAIQDGIPEEKLDKVNLNENKYIDLSTFNKVNPNPHNFNAMQESKRQGFDIGHAYINESSPPEKVTHFLELARPRNEAFGIQGVIIKRQGINTSDHIIRMYSHKSYEKHKNI